LENINIAPARDRYKIFIIDEVHMLSNSSFNALLKTLEEPPPTVVFIMATTELHKVPDTIASRCQEFEFRIIAVQKIFERLKLIAESEKISITDDALKEIARSGEGSMRDAQSNFDQVISFSGDKIEVSDVEGALGLAGAETAVKVLKTIDGQDAKGVLDVVADLVSRGHDLRVFCRGMLGVFRDLLVCRVGGEQMAETASLGPDAMKDFSSKFSESDLIRYFNSLGETESKLREAVQSRYVLEIGLVKLVEMRRLAPIESIVGRLSAMQGGKVSDAPERSEAASAGQEKKTLNPEPPLREENAFAEEPTFIPEEPAYLRDEPPAWPESPVIDLGNLDALPVKLPPIAAEELEHVDHPQLDALFEDKLTRLGESTLPIPNVAALAAQMIGSLASNGAADTKTSPAPPAKPNIDLSRFFKAGEEDQPESAELPKLPPNPTDQELVAYVNAHPLAKRVMKLFRATIVDVRRRDT
jgi:DNA polymerase-3 subunit gamma/tau